MKKVTTLLYQILILIDGGKGQYSSAKEVLDEFGLHDLPMIAIAKGKMRNSGDETFFYNGKSFKFEKNDPTLFFMQRLRDEAHRFAITSHRAKRAKGIKKSLLDQINGIGAIRKRALLNHFGSARAVESASLDEIKSVEGVEAKVAKKIYNFFPRIKINMLRKIPNILTSRTNFNCSFFCISILFAWFLWRSYSFNIIYCCIIY